VEQLRAGSHFLMKSGHSFGAHFLGASVVDGVELPHGSFFPGVAP
jgi:hypothetical protein